MEDKRKDREKYHLALENMYELKCKDFLLRTNWLEEQFFVCQSFGSFCFYGNNFLTQ
jgi:hypothetical protein